MRHNPFYVLWTCIALPILGCVTSEELSGRRGMPAPVQVATGGPKSCCLSLHHGELTWVSYGRVMQLSPAGAVATRSPPDVAVTAVALSGDSVFWSQEGRVSPGALVVKAPRAGGDPETVFAGAGTAYGLAANPAGVFFLHTSEVQIGGGRGIAARVMGVLADGTVKQYTGEMAHAVALASDGASLFLASGGPKYPGVAQIPPGRIDACPISGCDSGLTNLVSDMPALGSNLVAHDGWVYSGGWNSLRVPCAGGGPQTLGRHDCWYIAVDDLGIYCAGPQFYPPETLVYQRLWENGQDAVLADLPDVPSSVAVDERSVYWTTDNGVFRVDRWSGAATLDWLAGDSPGSGSATGELLGRGR